MAQGIWRGRNCIRVTRIVASYCHYSTFLVVSAVNIFQRSISCPKALQSSLEHERPRDRSPASHQTSPSIQTQECPRVLPGQARGCKAHWPAQTHVSPAERLEEGEAEFINCSAWPCCYPTSSGLTRRGSGARHTSHGAICVSVLKLT